MRDILLRIIAAVKRQYRRSVSFALVAILSLGFVTGALYFTGLEAIAEEYTCQHHTEHNDSCGYIEAVAAQPCNHTHDEDCGYSEGTSGQDCSHICGDDCYITEVICVHDCEDGCDETCDHADNCDCPEDLTHSCIHEEHDDSCGYQEAGADSPCAHVHDDSCGYVAAVQGHTCEFVCYICESGQTQGQTGDGGSDASGGSGTDGTDSSTSGSNDTDANGADSTDSGDSSGSGFFASLGSQFGVLNTSSTTAPVVARISHEDGEKTGGLVTFYLYSTYSTPTGEFVSEDFVWPTEIHFEIPITNPGFIFSYANTSVVTNDSEDYPTAEGWIKIQLPLNAGESTENQRYLYYNENQQLLAYSLKAGETISTYLSFYTENGTTLSGEELALEPEINSTLTFPEGAREIEGDSADVTAEFGWQEIDKTSSALGTLGNVILNQGYDDITYTIKASPDNVGASTGLMYTGTYTVTDTLAFENLYILLNAGAVIKPVTPGDKVVYITIDNTDYELFEIEGTVTGSSIEISPTVSGDMLTGFTFTYTVTQGQTVTSEIEAVDLTVTLYGGSTIGAYLRATTGASDAGQIVNTVNIEAKSMFYDTVASDKKDDHIDGSSDSVVDLATGRHILLKRGFDTEAEATAFDPADYTYNTSNAVGGYGETDDTRYQAVLHGNTVYYTIYYKNTSATLTDLYLSDFLIVRTQNGKEYFDLSTLNVESITTGDASGMTYNTTPLGWDGVSGEISAGASGSNPYVNPYIALDYGSDAADFTYIYMYKQFQNVPVGAWIQITYSVELLDTDDLNHVDKEQIGYNFAFASTVTPDTIASSTGVLAWDYTQIILEPDDNKIDFSKSIRNASELTEEITTVDVGGTFIYALELNNPSKLNSATFERIVEVWPFDAAKLTGITLLASDGSTVSAATRKTLNITFYSTVDEDDIVDANWNDDTDDTLVYGPVTMYDLDTISDELWNSTIKNATYFTITGRATDGSNTSCTIEPDTMYYIKMTAELIGTSGATNEAWLEFPNDPAEPGPGYHEEGVTINPSVVSINTEKYGYKVQLTDEVTDEEVKEALFNSIGDGNEPVTTGYRVGDYVRFEITVTNTSLSQDDLKWLFLYDNLPAMMSTTGDDLKVVYYKDYNGVLSELPRTTSSDDAPHQNGIIQSTSETAWAEIRKHCYRISGGYIYAPIKEDSLGNPFSFPVGESVTFYLFFELTAETLERYNSLNFQYQTNNTIYTYAGTDYTKLTEHVTSSDVAKVNLSQISDPRRAGVTKSAFGVFKQDGTSFVVNSSNTEDRKIYFDQTKDPIRLASDEDILTAENGDYLIYQLALKNSSPALVDEDQINSIQVYSVYDILPEGTQFEALQFISTTFTSSTANLEYNYNLLGYNSTIYLYTNMSGNRVSTKGTISYDDGSRMLSIVFEDAQGVAAPITLTQSRSLYIYVVLKVTDASKAPYDNIGGFEVESVLQVVEGDTDKIESGDVDTQVITDFATIGGPTYYAGINKTAYQINTIGTTWVEVADTAIIDPGYPVRWKIELSNGEDSTSAIRKYTVKDVLPDEFSYQSAWLADAEGNKILDLTVPSDPTVKEYSWVIDTEVAGYEDAAIPVGGSVYLMIESVWAGGSTFYGSYQNQALLTLHVDYPLEEATKGGVLQDDPQTIYSTAIVNMMGAYATSSFKTIENVTTSSPFYEDFAYDMTRTTDAYPTDYIESVAGDTVKYTLTIKNESNHILENMVIIDVLPHMEDTGVVNTIAPRYSQFDLLFTETPQLTVTIPGRTTTQLTAADYTVHYALTEGATTLNKTDWLTESLTPELTWGNSSLGMNTIRIALNDGVVLDTGETIEVTFQAKTASASMETLPAVNEIAWNSFGYGYNAVDRSDILWAEPLRVGVKMSWATIDLEKVLYNADGTLSESDDIDFSFQLERRNTKTGGWTAATGVLYTRDGKIYEVEVDEDGNCIVTVKAGETVQLYVPAGSYYRITEVNLPAGYELTSGSFAPDDTLEDGDSHEVTFTNTRLFIYELPETGGAGLGSYTLGGIAMLATASIGAIPWITMRKKRKKEGVPS